MIDYEKRIREHFAESARLKLDASETLAPHIARASRLMTDCLLSDGKILACGNGGSAADAQHFAAELVGRFERERPELPAIALTTDTSLLTAVANDAAGNETHTTFGPIMIDQTAPSIQAAADAGGQSYSAGTWTNQSVFVHFDCFDTLSGVAPGSCGVSGSQEVAVTVDGSSTVSGVAGDRAGNSSQSSFGPIMIDTVNTGNWVTVTPDDRQVVFVSIRSGLPRTWTVSLDGGMPTQLFDGLAVTPHVSSSGTLLVYGTPDPQNRPTVVVCDFPACAARRSLMTPANLAAVGLKWMPDSRTVAYIDTTLSNIWGLPIDGKTPYPLTKFTDGRTITDFAWSRDGKRLAISRSVTVNNIVLFKGLRH